MNDAVHQRRVSFARHAENAEADRAAACEACGCDYRDQQSEMVDLIDTYFLSPEMTPAEFDERKAEIEVEQDREHSPQTLFGVAIYQAATGTPLARFQVAASDSFEAQHLAELHYGAAETLVTTFLGREGTAEYDERWHEWCTAGATEFSAHGVRGMINYRIN